ncbi:MAG: bifunctional nuclease domain-containing protein [Candidatus Dormibacteraceae bacterium]
MGQSNPTDLESIGRFSRRAGIPVSHLRHYHEMGLLEPAFVDPESGYRYYAIAQREAAEVIAILRSIDMPVRDIQRVLGDPSEATVGEVLAAHRARLEDRLSQVAARLEAIDRIVKEGKLVKQPRQVDEDGFVAVRVESVQAVTPTAERWRELRDKMPRLVGDQPQEVHVVILTAESGQRLPIWVGTFEAQALKLHLDGLKTERPLTYDLMLDVLHRHGVRVVRVDVLSVVDGTFLARLITNSDGQVEELDCRPSDAFNLALRAGAPVAVAQALLDQASDDPGADLAL